MDTLLPPNTPTGDALASPMTQTESPQMVAIRDAVQPFRDWLRLDQERKDLEAQAAEKKEQRDALTPLVKNLLYEIGVNSFSIDGRELYLYERVFIGKQDKPIEEIAAAVSAIDELKEYAKPAVNIQGLTGLANEMQEKYREDFFEKYPTLQGFLKRSSEYAIRARKDASKKKRQE